MKNKFKKFLGFEQPIPQVLSDKVFWIIGAERKEELTKDIAQLNEDLSFGIPFKLKNFENEVIKDVKERGVIVSMDIYEFPIKRVREYIALVSLREQLKITIKPDGSESMIGGELLRDVIDSSIPIIFGEVINDDVKRKIRDKKANIQELISKINEEIEGKTDKSGAIILKGKYHEFKEKLDEYYQQLVTRTESIWGKGGLKEFLDKAKTTIRWIDPKIGEIEKESIGKDENEELNAETKYDEMKKKKLWYRIDKLSEEVISLLSQIEEKIRKKNEQSCKLALLAKAVEHLENRQNKIIALNKRLTEFYQEKIAPPLDNFVKIPNLSDLLDSNYKLPSLDFEEIKKEWMKTKGKEIEEKMKQSFKVDLKSIRVKDPHEGWIPVNWHINKSEAKISIVPDFAQIEGEEHFDYLVKRRDYWKVVKYQFLFNVSMKEFLKAFNRKWYPLEKEE